MRVTLDVEDREGELFAVLDVAAPGPTLPLPERPVRWVAGGRLLVAKDEQLTDEEAADLATDVRNGSASKKDMDRYGAILFRAAFGVDNWGKLTEAAVSIRAPHLEVAIRGPQSLRWEALHDGTNPVAAKGTGSHGQLSVAIVRLVAATRAFPANAPSSVFPVTHIPRVLFAVGSRLTDPRVRPGAEFMGIMRHLERQGGTIQPRVLEQATEERLAREIDKFEPDVLHMIGHGRWDEYLKRVGLELCPEPGGGPGDPLVTADQLLEIFDAAGHLPKVVVLSACQTASADEKASESCMDAVPFAAELVAGGVPVVVAMAGDVSDLGCRIFARALTHAISDGAPITEAVTVGRRAAFHKRHGPENGDDWLLPTVFVADDIPAGTPLVDTTPITRSRDRCRALDLAWEPVFCGRREFFEKMDHILDPEHPLNVLVAYTDDSAKRYGSLRLLRELAARAVREDWLPVLLGPIDQKIPATREDFAGELRDRLMDMRGNLGLPGRPDRLVAAASSGPKNLAQAIRETFAELVADLPEDDPARGGPQPRVVLLCHRVDWWEDVLPELFGTGSKMIGPRGLGTGAYPVPVVLTGADVSELRRARLERYEGAPWVDFAPLGRFRKDGDDPEDILAYLWWLLNPEEGPVYAPKRGVDQAEVADVLRHAMREVIYDRLALFGQAKALRSMFTSGRDTDLIAAYRKAAP